MTFTLIEDNNIDIDSIEEIGKMLGWALLTEENVNKQKESINFTLNFFGEKINEIIERQNMTLGAVKQLNREIKELKEK